MFLFLVKPECCGFQAVACNMIRDMYIWHIYSFKLYLIYFSSFLKTTIRSNKIIDKLHNESPLVICSMINFHSDMFPTTAISIHQELNYYHTVVKRSKVLQLTTLYITCLIHNIYVTALYILVFIFFWKQIYIVLFF